MSDTSGTVTDESAFKHGSLGLQIRFAITTLGIYTVYWTYKVHKQLNAGTDADVSTGLRTVAYILPVVYFIAVWKISHDAEPITGKDGILVFLLFCVFPPTAWYLIQTGMTIYQHGKLGASIDRTCGQSSPVARDVSSYHRGREFRYSPIERGIQ